MLITTKKATMMTTTAAAAMRSNNRVSLNNNKLKNKTKMNNNNNNNGNGSLEFMTATMAPLTLANRRHSAATATATATTTTMRASATAATSTATATAALLLLKLSAGLLLLLAFSSDRASVEAWQPDVRPDLQHKQDKILARFIGNTTDYFKILDHDDATLLVGAKDAIYNISLHNLREINRLEWRSADADRDMCSMKGKPEFECHNFVRVFARLNNSQLLLCGTNSYKPRCRYYKPTNTNTNPDAVAVEEAANKKSLMRYETVHEFDAQGMCQYSPRHNSSYAYAGGQLYSAIADFTGSDALIYRDNLRTEASDFKQLNQPHFVGAFEYGDYVFFFFRELFVDYAGFGKAIYSRVARVCKNDRGGPFTFSKSWTTFLKLRLTCAVPGDIPFYFDELQAITALDESGVNAVVYGVFTTQANAIPGSAVCAFNMHDIMTAFDETDFKGQRDSHSPRPGQCVEDSRTLSSIAVNFVKMHPLISTPVLPIYNRPLMTKANLHHRLIAIAIDAHIKALDGSYYDVIYTGTDDGKITKFVNVPPTTTQSVDDGVQLRTMVISELQVLKLGVPVRELIVSRKTNTLVVVSDDSVISVLLHRCALMIDCAACLALQDPSCAWDQQNNECKNIVTSLNQFDTKGYLQALNTSKKEATAQCAKFNIGVGVDGNIVLPGGVATVINLNELPVAANEQQQQNAASSVNANNNQDPNNNLLYTKVHGNAGDKVNSNDLNEHLNENGHGASINNNNDDYPLNDFNEQQRTTLAAAAAAARDSEHLLYPERSMADRGSLQLASTSYLYAIGTIFVALVFIVGVVVGTYMSRKHCKASVLHASSHRNQFHSPPPYGMKLHNSGGKDINLLINSNHYCNAQKKANLDLEKDRSHECKNSSEQLEKELPFKTTTLTKVKRTYI